MYCVLIFCMQISCFHSSWGIFEVDLVLLEWMLVTNELHNVYIHVQLCLFCNVAQWLVNNMSQTFPSVCCCTCVVRGAHQFHHRLCSRTQTALRVSRVTSVIAFSLSLFFPFLLLSLLLCLHKFCLTACHCCSWAGF